MKKYKHKNNGSIMTYKDGCMRIENLVIEGQPNLEYWEEVTEKNYRIVSVMSTKYNSPYGEGRLLDIAGPESPWNIHSVKRLSDGEIFTVGDRVSIISANKNIHYIIDRLKITDNGIYVNASSDCNKKRFGQNLTSIQHVKKPLFTTEDGVCIPEDSKVYWVINKKGVYNILQYSGLVRNHRGILEKKDSIYSIFSTRKSAEEFILMNNKYLSGQDVVDYLKEQNIKTEDILPEFLKFLKKKQNE